MEGLNRLREGFESLPSGSKTPLERFFTLTTACRTLHSAKKTLSSAGKTLHSAEKTLNAGSNRLDSGSITSRTGSNRLSPGCGTLRAGWKSLKPAVAALICAPRTLWSGPPRVCRSDASREVPDPDIAMRPDSMVRQEAAVTRECVTSGSGRFADFATGVAPTSFPQAS